MTRVAEQEIKDTLKKSEFKGMVATVISTATILIGIFVGGLKIVDAVKDGMRIELKAEIKSQLTDLEKRQLVKDNAQDADIQDIKNAVNNMTIKSK